MEIDIVLNTRKSDLMSCDRAVLDSVIYACAYLYTFVKYRKAPICEFNDLNSVLPAEHIIFITKRSVMKDQIELFDKFGTSDEVKAIVGLVFDEFAMYMAECSVILANLSINIDEQTKFVELYNSQSSIFDQFDFLKACISK